MKAYLMTRGTLRRMDYDFLGETPPDRWWERIADGGWIMQDYPEVAVAGHGGRTGIMASGLPSRRRDVIRTELRYTLVITDAHDEPDLALRLVAALLTPTGQATLGALLDEQFDVRTVDTLLGGGTADIDIPARLDTILRDWNPPLEDRDGDDLHGSWAGRLDDPTGRAAFLGRVRRLLDDTAGLAFTSHSVSTISGAERARHGLGETVAILLADSDTVDEVQPLGKAPAPSPTGLSPSTTRLRHLRVRPLPTLVTATASTLALAIWWWIGSR
ncbi:hypothetical protein [Catellatospora sp. NPDC049609]|uniref:hypothetical protein n=1 Tax=Catellatospora sp. NPDC049609 TaxID=3155505 RepID=UPI003414EDAC